MKSAIVILSASLLLSACASTRGLKCRGEVGKAETACRAQCDMYRLVENNNRSLIETTVLCELAMREQAHWKKTGAPYGVFEYCGDIVSSGTVKEFRDAGLEFLTDASHK